MPWALFQLVHVSILIEVIKAKIFTELDTRYLATSNSFHPQRRYIERGTSYIRRADQDWEF